MTPHQSFRSMRQRFERLQNWLRRCVIFRVFRSDIAHVTEVCERAAAGDLEARIVGIRRDTKFGKMCATINRALDASDAFVREAAAAMENCSRDSFHRPILLRGLQGSYYQSAATINSAAAVMKTHSDNLHFVAAQASETATQVHAVAAACEELNATTTEISGQTKEASDRAREVSRQLGEMKATFERLQQAVTKIDGVVGLLNTVAVQTQLLGLNAAVEAAHAGERGAGFSVVAGEVKSLSDDTRRASDQILSELREIKTSAQAAGIRLQAISSTIVKVEESTDAINVSIREQVGAASAINTSIVAVSAQSEEIATRIDCSRERS